MIGRKRQQTAGIGGLKIPEYIEREALLQVLEELGGWDDPPDLWAEGYAWGTFRALRRVEDQPTADVVEVRHGKWIETQEPLGWCDVDCAECSVCHESWIIDEDSSIDDYECMWRYCPNCGAKMDGGT